MRRHMTRVAIAFLTSGVGLLPTPAEAGAAGSVEITAPSGGELRTGGSSTAFRIKLDRQAACTGDSANAGYRIQSYLVPESVDPGTLTFDAGVGPSPVDGQFRAALYETSSTSFVDQQTAEASKVGGPGPVIQPLPALSFAVFDPALGFPFTPGAYNVGIACTLGPPSDTQLDRYWNTVMTITADPGDAPAGIRWAVAAPPGGSRTKSPAGWVAATAAALAACALALLLRGRRTGAQPPKGRPSPSHLEELR
jgi:hypothetical protein